MDRTQITLLIIGAVMVLFTLPITRRSARKDKIHGGGLPQALHTLAVAAYLAVLPSALCGSFLVGPWKLGIPLAFGFLALAFASLIVFAIFELPAREQAQKEDRGWTEKDARSSGL